MLPVFSSFSKIAKINLINVFVSNTHFVLGSDHMINNMTAWGITPAVTKPSLTDITVDQSWRIMDTTVRAT
jgi:hypothetical protein